MFYLLVFYCSHIKVWVQAMAMLDSLAFFNGVDRLFQTRKNCTLVQNINNNSGFMWRTYPSIKMLKVPVLLLPRL